MANLLTNSTFNGVRVDTAGCDSNIIAGRGSWGGITSAPGVKNTAFGDYAMGTAGAYTSYTTAVGYRTLGDVGPPPTHNFAVAIGSYALSCSSCGDKNTGVGFRTLRSVSGCYNTAIGSCAGESMTTGTNNTLVGFKAGQPITTGNSNTGIGTCALASAGSAASSNIAIGFRALLSASCNQNIAVGYCAGYNVTTACNTIAIGYKSTTSNTNNHTAAGNSGCSTFCVGISWTTLSDCRDKTDIETLSTNLGLNFIRKLRPVKYNFDFRDKYVRECNFEYGTKDGTLKNEKKSYGFLAQEMETALLETSASFDALNYNSKEDHYRLIYADLIAPVVQAVQDTLTRLEDLEKLQSNG